MTTCAIIPVNGRIPLLRQTIYRLLHHNGITHVVCVGDNAKDRKVCLQMGAHWIDHANYPLGAKWNKGFKWAMEILNPDAYLFVGSSDWISDNWMEYALPMVTRDGYDLVGKRDFYLFDIATTENRLCHWSGYTESGREDEPIGIGRVLSRNIVQLMEGKPFNDDQDSSLDYIMWHKVAHYQGSRILIEGDHIKSLSLSHYAWPNKHRFNDHWHGLLPSTLMHSWEQWMEDHFPNWRTIDNI